MTTIQDVAAAIAAENTIDASVLALLNGLAAQVKAAQASTVAGDAAAMDKLVADIQAHAATMQAAVVANTPVTPAQAAAKP
jgi:hypothetical protein